MGFGKGLFLSSATVWRLGSPMLVAVVTTIGATSAVALSLPAPLSHALELAAQSTELVFSSQLRASASRYVVKLEPGLEVPEQVEHQLLKAGERVAHRLRSALAVSAKLHRLRVNAGSLGAGRSVSRAVLVGHETALAANGLELEDIRQAVASQLASIEVLDADAIRAGRELSVLVQQMKDGSLPAQIDMRADSQRFNGALKAYEADEARRNDSVDSARASLVTWRAARESELAAAQLRIDSARTLVTNSRAALEAQRAALTELVTQYNAGVEKRDGILDLDDRNRLVDELMKLRAKALVQRKQYDAGVAVYGEQEQDYLRARNHGQTLLSEVQVELKRRSVALDDLQRAQMEHVQLARAELAGRRAVIDAKRAALRAALRARHRSAEDSWRIVRDRTAHGYAGHARDVHARVSEWLAGGSVEALSHWLAELGEGDTALNGLRKQIYNAAGLVARLDEARVGQAAAIIELDRINAAANDNAAKWASAREISDRAWRDHNSAHADYVGTSRRAHDVWLAFFKSLSQRDDPIGEISGLALARMELMEMEFVELRLVIDASNPPPNFKALAVRFADRVGDLGLPSKSGLWNARGYVEYVAALAPCKTSEGVVSPKHRAGSWLRTVGARAKVWGASAKFAPQDRRIRGSLLGVALCSHGIVEESPDGLEAQLPTGRVRLRPEGFEAL
jgi:hypothetical protein